MTVTTANITLIVEIDWDKDGSWSTSDDDISSFVKKASSRRGFTNPLDFRERVAAAGSCDLVLDNADRRFSPGYGSGPYYNKLLPGRPVRVRATDGVTIWPMWAGYTASITPQAGIHSEQECTIHCVDALSKLQAYSPSLPLRELIRTDEIITLLVASSTGGTAAAGTFTFSGPVINTDTFTVGDRVYTVVGAPAAADEVKLETVVGAFEADLAAAINNDLGVGTLYGTGTTRHAHVAATVIASDGIANQTGSENLGETYNILAGQYLGETRTIDRLTLKLQKGGTPTNATVKVVSAYTDTTPVDPNASKVLTAAEVALSSWGDIPIVFPGSFTLTTGDFIQLSYGAQTPGSRYLWATGSGPSHQGYRHTFAGVWSGVLDFAFWVPGTLTLEAVAVGTWGNALALATTSSAAVASGTTFTGGSDGTQPLDLDTGLQVFSYTGDRWRGDVDALTALNDVLIGEWGYGWLDASGTLMFKNRDFYFQLYQQAAALALDNEQFDLISGVDLETVFNEILVTYTPRGETVSGTLIRSRGPIQVPGQWGTARWAGSTLPIINPNGGSLIVKLPAQDDNGNYLGIKSLVLPPVAGTHYTVNENADGSGFDYTAQNHIGISVVTNGGDTENSFTNDALAPLYVRDYYLDGVGLIAFDPQQVIYADQDSVDAYGRRSLPVYLPIPVDHSMVNELSAFLLQVFKDPVNRVTRVSLSADRVYGGVNPHALDIGDVIPITETQTALSAQKHVVMGGEWRYVKGQSGVIVLDVLRVPDTVYGIFDDSVFDEAVYAL